MDGKYAAYLKALAHTRDLVAGHVLGLSCLNLAAAGGAWAWGNLSMALLIASTLGALIAVLIVARCATFPKKHRWARLQVMSSCIASIACLVNATVLLTRSAPSSNCIVLPRTSLDVILETATSTATSDWRVVKRHLVKLGEDQVYFRGHSAGVRLEVSIYDPATKVLWLPTADFVERWPPEVAHRTYDIAGHSPSGMSTAAGECWRTRTWLNIKDTSESKVFRRFPDDLESKFLPTLSILCVPIFNHREPRSHPIGVLSLVSPEANSFTPEDLALAQIYANALSHFFSRRQMPTRQ